MLTRGARVAAQTFVAIPAYRDRELAPTLLDLFAKAQAPGRLRVVVAWQHGPRDRLAKAVSRLRNLELIAIPAEESRGPNWARRLLQRRYDHEPFTLLLDSHHRFVNAWDTKLLRMFDGVRQSVPKPILTAYLPPYDPVRDPRGRTRKVMKIYPLKRSDGLLTHLTGRPVALWRTLKRPFRADFASLHFLFAEGRFHHDIPFDPSIYFFGDEVFTGLRAFTHGYDLYHPHTLLGWHLYDRATRTTHWNDHAEWRRAEARSYATMRRLASGARSRLLSSERSVRAYEAHIGLKLCEPAART
jgi:hypothetical protein